MAAASAGISFEELVELLARAALDGLQ